MILPEYSITKEMDEIFFKHPTMVYINRMRSVQSKGADIVGATLAKMQALWELTGFGDLADRLVYSPGDRTLTFGDKDPYPVDMPTRVGLGLPIAYDVWYLYDAGNVLIFGGKTREETMEKMEDYFDSIDNAKPLKPPETAPTPGAYLLTGGGGSGVTPDTLGAVAYAIKEARYEVFPTGNSEMYASDGPKQRQGSYAGYIAFPVGPLGVMWGISLTTESSLSGGSSGSVRPVDAQNATVPGGELLPPFDVDRAEVAGQKLMSKGYLVEDDTCVEILAAECGGDTPALHQWLRYWIKPDNTEIIPGEFVGMLCRPWPLHCWWFQETSPILYAGNWIETEFYTSGIVKEVQVIDEDFEPQEGEVGNRYKVWVKNEEIIVKSTDFFEYEVDERVGLLKTYREGEGESYDMSMGPVGSGSGQATNFNWQHLELQNTGEALNTEWVIVPAGFYENGSGSMGGV